MPKRSARHSTAFSMIERTSDDSGDLDPRVVRLHFARAAATYDEAAVLQREVGRRMAEKLDVVKLAPALILDAGCGTGDAQASLALRYPEARQVALDLALPMLSVAKAKARAQAREGKSMLSRLLSAVSPAARREAET
jgi:malonyl-CoA O-methyltransferase